MAQYEIQSKTLAAKEFRKLPQDIKSRICKAINALKTTLAQSENKKAGSSYMGIPSFAEWIQFI
ncbi:MAG: hypothetical protein D6742_17270 [Cyanobacteria bacterium J069]|nr:MAG: hypothetical protein D6742_17270 [Cyanobacteria bacterium J069]